MRKKHKRLIWRTAGLITGLIAGAGLIAFLASRQYDVLDAKGIISEQQRDLMLFVTVLSLIIILPVFALTIHIVARYRVGSKQQGSYSPEWDGSRKLETLWWGIPGVIILVLSVVTWQTSHSLDPYRPIASDKEPLTIQVVALQWKWLFLYPDHKIATVNYVQFPVDRPVNFRITADAPMNSFWIPQLGGQVYAMNGMTTQLHLMANETGRFQGSSANLSGDGFAGMRFIAQATKQSEFDLWSGVNQQSAGSLDEQSYALLAQPSSNTTPITYTLEDTELYNKIIDKYMSHGGHTSTSYIPSNSKTARTVNPTVDLGDADANGRD